MTLSAKDKAKIKLLEYLGDPDNDFPSRAVLSIDVLGYKNSNQINVLFTALELQEIEYEALEIRKKNSAKIIGKAYKALEKHFDKNVAAITEYLNRMEGKVTDKIKMDADVDAKVKLNNMSDEDIDAEISKLLKDK